ncbi:MAG: P-loop NTPase [Eubacteriales bacterium]
MQENNNIVKNLFYAAMDVLKHLLLVLLGGILVGSCAFVIANECYKPKFTTRVTFIVTSRESSSNAYTNLSTAQSLVEVLDLVLQSSELEKLILLDTGWESVPGEINTQVITETNLLVLSASASSPREAFLVMKAVLNNYTTIFSAVADDAVLTVYAPASVPTLPDNPLNATGIAKKAAIVGVFAFALFIGALSYFSTGVKNAKELQNHLNTALLVTLPYESEQWTWRRLFRRRKNAILLTDPGRSTGYVEAIKALRSKVESIKRNKGYSVFMVTSSMANEGKSTVAANLALSLAQRTYKVALIDCDMWNPSLARILQRKVVEINHLDDYLAAKGDYRNLTLKTDPKTGLILMIRDGAKEKNSRTPISKLMAPVLESIRTQVDFVIVDTSPMVPVSDALELSDLMDASMLVVRENAESEERVSSSVEALKGCTANFMGCVYNGERFATSQIPVDSYGYGKYGRYGKYGKYGKYGRYSRYGAYSAGASNETSSDEENDSKTDTEEKGGTDR